MEKEEGVDEIEGEKRMERRGISGEEKSSKIKCEGQIQEGRKRMESDRAGWV